MGDILVLEVNKKQKVRISISINKWNLNIFVQIQPANLSVRYRFKTISASRQICSLTTTIQELQNTAVTPV